MPTYEYNCEKCDHHFDIVQSIKDEPLTVCPKDRCAQKKWGKGRVKRAIGLGGGLIFKGSGFYITDYRSESYKEAAKKESGGGSGGDAKPSESKPADSKTSTTPAATPAKPAPAAKSEPAKTKVAS